MLALPAMGVLFRRPSTDAVALCAWIFAFVFFSMVVGLRFRVGGDWEAYLGYLDRAAMMSYPEIFKNGDPGYYFLNWVAVRLGVGIVLVNSFAGAILVAGVVAFSRQQPLPSLAFFVAVPYLIIVVGMGYSRQAIALGFVLLGLSSFRGNKVSVFIIWVLIGAAFHKSAVIMLPFAALAVDKNRFWSAAWIGMVFLIGFYLFLFDSVDTLWVNYVEADYESEGGFIRVIMNAIPALLYLRWHRKFNLNNGVHKLWWWLSIFSLVCVPLVVLSSTATDRVALYLIPLQLFVFSRVHLVTSDLGKRAFIVIAVLAYYSLVQLVWLFFASHSYAWLPYQMYPFAS